MTTAEPTNAIPDDVALQLCRQIREANRGKLYRWQAWMCWGCTTFTRGETSKMCWCNAPGNRGCIQVNACYDSLVC